MPQARIEAMPLSEAEHAVLALGYLSSTIGFVTVTAAALSMRLISVVMSEGKAVIAEPTAA